MTEENTFLPLGSLVILKGALKKLMIVNRACLFDGKYFDYGAVLYPEGMIDNNLAYFSQEDIFKVVFESFTDDDDNLMVEQLRQAKEAYFAAQRQPAESMQTALETLTQPDDDDPFATVRDMEDYL
ncbi:DUF4176 domain-containing protein [Lactovum odontotermitis]